MALLTARADRSRALDWIQIGAIAGPTIQLPSVALRSAKTIWPTADPPGRRTVLVP
jgi:hypothetical protein